MSFARRYLPFVLSAYIAFVFVGTVGLLVPLAAVFAGLSVIVDRHSGAQK